MLGRIAFGGRGRTRDPPASGGQPLGSGKPGHSSLVHRGHHHVCACREYPAGQRGPGQRWWPTRQAPPLLVYGPLGDERARFPARVPASRSCGRYCRTRPPIGNHCQGAAPGGPSSSSRKARDCSTESAWKEHGNPGQAASRRQGRLRRQPAAREMPREGYPAGKRDDRGRVRPSPQRPRQVGADDRRNTRVPICWWRCRGHRWSKPGPICQGIGTPTGRLCACSRRVRYCASSRPASSSGSDLRARAIVDSKRTAARLPGSIPGRGKKFQGHRRPRRPSR